MLLAIGKVGQTYLVLAQDWETRADGVQMPVFVRISGRTFKSFSKAERFARFKYSNGNPDEVVRSVIHREKGIGLRINDYFAKVPPALEYLIH